MGRVVQLTLFREKLPFKDMKGELLISFMWIAAAVWVILQQLYCEIDCEWSLVKFSVMCQIYFGIEIIEQRRVKFAVGLASDHWRPASVTLISQSSHFCVFYLFLVSFATTFPTPYWVKIFVPRKSDIYNQPVTNIIDHLDFNPNHSPDVWN